MRNLSRFISLFALVAISLTGQLAWAQSSTAPQEEVDVARTLQAIQTAAKKLNYSGTFVYQQGNQIRTSRITHANDAEGEVEKLEILDGKPREYIRRNGEVSCYLPEAKLIQVEKNLTQEEFPALLGENISSLPQSYLIKKAQMSRVAGAECQVLNFQPKDSLRYGFKLCVEKNTSLLLGIQTLNQRQEVIEQIAFTQVAIGEIDKARLKPSYSGTSAWKTEHLTVKANVNSGWLVKSLPFGYKKTLETRRLIPMSGSAADAEVGASKANEVVQMMFSDGLSTFSVFIEPNSGDRTEGSLQQGAMTITAKRQGDHWITVVGEVPAAAIKQVVSSIQFKK